MASFWSILEFDLLKTIQVIQEHLSDCSCHVVDENDSIKEQLADLSCDGVSDITKLNLDNQDHPWIIPNNLSKLSITNSKMTTEQFENLKWIQSLTKLHYLNLTGNELTDIPSVKLAVSGVGVTDYSKNRANSFDPKNYLNLNPKKN